jgi:hypothetical protein
LHDLREAIRIATSFDDDKVNRNFSYDWEAYAEVKRLLEMLISCEAISDAMEIAVHFMEQASRPIENSNEGMMLEEVESCLKPILLALENHDEAQRTAWAIRMQKVDRVGFVCHAKLQEWSARIIDLRLKRPSNFRANSLLYEISKIAFSTCGC